MVVLYNPENTRFNPMFNFHWVSVVDGGPTLNQHYTAYLSTHNSLTRFRLNVGPAFPGSGVGHLVVVLLALSGRSNYRTDSRSSIPGQHTCGGWPGNEA